jgi:hypothetical protein
MSISLRRASLVAAGLALSATVLAGASSSSAGAILAAKPQPAPTATQHLYVKTFFVTGNPSGGKIDDLVITGLPPGEFVSNWWVDYSPYPAVSFSAAPGGQPHGLGANMATSDVNAPFTLRVNNQSADLTVAVHLTTTSGTETVLP